MENKLYVVMLIVIMFMLITITNGAFANQQMSYDDYEVIKVAINDGGLFVPMGNNFIIEIAIDEYEWKVNDTKYKFETTRIDWADVFNEAEFFDYDVHIIDGFTNEMFLLSVPNLKFLGLDIEELKDNLRNFIENEGHGFIGRCAGSWFPPKFDGIPFTVHEQRYGEKCNFLGGGTPNVESFFRSGVPIISQHLKPIFKDGEYIGIWKRTPQDPSAVAEQAYESYNSHFLKKLNPYTKYNFPGVCLNLVNSKFLTKSIFKMVKTNLVNLVSHIYPQNIII